MAEYNLSATLSLKDKFTGTIRNFKKDMKDVQTQNKRVVKSFGNLRSSVNGLVPTMGAAGIVAAVNKSTKAFASLEVQNIRNRKTIGASKDDYKKLEDQQKSLSKTGVYSQLQIAKSQEFMAKAGWNTNKILSATPDILNLVTASGEDMAAVSDIVTDGMTAMGMSADQTETFVDQLLMTTNKSNANIMQMGESYKYVLPIAGSLGESLEDVNTLLGVGANIGIKASQSGTSLRMGYQKLIKPTAESAKVLDYLNIKTKDANGQFKGMVDITNQLRNKTADMTDTQRAQVVSTLFGAEASTFFTGVLATQKEDMIKLNKTIAESKGETKKFADELNDTTDGAMKKMSVAADSLKTKIGELSAPTVTKGLEKTTDFLNSLTEDTKEGETNRNIAKIGAAAGAGAAVGGVVGGAPGAATGAAAGGILMSGAIVGDIVSQPAVRKMTATKAMGNVEELKRRSAETDYRKRYGESSSITIQNLNINGAQDPKKVLDEFVKRTSDLAKTQ